jgi:hypothetical protein
LGTDDGTTSTPPDMGFAAGGGFRMELVNDLGRIFDSSGQVLFTFTLGDLFVTDDSVVDPTVHFDQLSGRWFAAVFDETIGAELVMVTGSSDPAGDFFVYTIPEGDCPDQGKIGIADDVVTVSANKFTSCDGGDFEGAIVTVINKSQMLTGDTIDTHQGLFPGYFSLVPAQSLTSASKQWLAGLDADDATVAHIVSLSGTPPAAVTLNEDFTPSINEDLTPPDASQPSPFPVDSGDNRVQTATWRSNSLVFAANDACLPAGDSSVRACARLLRVNTQNGLVTLDEDISSRSQDNFYPAAVQDATGSIVVAFSRSSRSLMPQLDAALVNPDGTMATPVAVATGNAANNSGRYGDYNAVALDPDVPDQAWAAGEIGGHNGQGANGWATAVRALHLNDQSAAIKITETTAPASDPQDFGFTGTGGISPFSLDTDSTSATPNVQTLTHLVAGSYTITQNVPGGWNLATLVCTDPSRNTTVDLGTHKATIQLSLGETVACTFTNKTSSIKITQLTKPGASDPQDFGFTGTGGIAPFSLDTDSSDATLPNVVTITHLAAGAHTLTQTLPAGWTLTGLTCVDPTHDTTVDLANHRAQLELGVGETVSCTFTDTTSLIKLTQLTKPATSDPQDFGYTGTGGISPFSLDTDTSDTTLPNTVTLSHLNAGSHTLTQSVPGGWDLSALTCVDPTHDTTVDLNAQQAQVTLALGETVSCTFTDSTSSIRVTQVTSPASDPQDFGYTGSGGIGPFSLDTDPASAGTPNVQTITHLAAGTYTITQNVPGTWDLSALTCVDPTHDTTVELANHRAQVELAVGETVDCTFTDTTATLVVNVATSGPLNDPQDFSFTGSGGIAPFSLDTDSSDGTLQHFIELHLAAGTYTLTQAVPAGWDLSIFACSDPTRDSTADWKAHQVTVKLAVGERVNCYAQDDTNSIRLVQSTETYPRLFTDPQDFGFTGSGGISPVTLDTDPSSAGTPSERTITHLVAGTYTLAQVVPSGWNLTDISCDDPSRNSSVDVSSHQAQVVLGRLNTGNSALDEDGETVTCTFTDKAGGITITQKTAPSARARDPQDFGFTGTGGISPFALDTDTSSAGTPDVQTITHLAAGSYTITQLVPGGWSLTGLTCSDATRDSSVDLAAHQAHVTLAPGEGVSCVYTDTKT